MNYKLDGKCYTRKVSRLGQDIAWKRTVNTYSLFGELNESMKSLWWELSSAAEKKGPLTLVAYSNGAIAATEWALANDEKVSALQMKKRQEN